MFHKYVRIYIASVVLVRFNPATYTVTEEEDANAVITLETIGAHSDVINVTVSARSGNATSELICVCCIQLSYGTFLIIFIACINEGLSNIFILTGTVDGW